MSKSLIANDRDTVSPMPRPAGRPTGAPVGLPLARTSRAVSPAFEEALAGAGESVPIWIAQISLSSPLARNQREPAEAAGILEAALTHHPERHGSGRADHPPSRPGQLPGQEGQDR